MQLREGCHHLHGRPSNVGGFTLSGFSDITGGWRRNPVVSAAEDQSCRSKLLDSLPNCGRKPVRNVTNRRDHPAFAFVHDMFYKTLSPMKQAISWSRRPPSARTFRASRVAESNPATMLTAGTSARLREIMPCCHPRRPRTTSIRTLGCLMRSPARSCEPSHRMSVGRPSSKAISGWIAILTERVTIRSSVSWPRPRASGRTAHIPIPADLAAVAVLGRARHRGGRRSRATAAARGPSRRRHHPSARSRRAGAGRH